MSALKPCPFCGGKARIVYKDYAFLGQRTDGIKKIKYKAYATCNKCHARGKPVFSVRDDVYTTGWLARMKSDLNLPATEAWNDRTTTPTTGAC